MSKNNKPSWLSEVTDISKDVSIEAFSTPVPKAKFEVKNALVVANRKVSSTKKINVALRLDEDINETIDKETVGSRNEVINILLRYALEDIKKKGIPLTN